MQRSSVKLSRIIQSASNPITEHDTQRLLAYIKKHPKKVNKIDTSGKRPCDYAIHNFPLLILLALEGKAELPAQITDDPETAKWVEELRKEQAKNKLHRGWHLHDLIRKSAPLALIKNRTYRKHRAEINATSFGGRNACHWAALVNRPDMLRLLAEKGGDLNAKDMRNKTPLELATSPETKAVIKDLLGRTQLASSHQDVYRDDDWSDQEEASTKGLFTRFKENVGELSLGVIKAAVSPRTDTVEEARKPASPHRHDETHPRGRLTISPRENNPVIASPVKAARVRDNAAQGSGAPQTGTVVTIDAQPRFFNKPPIASLLKSDNLDAFQRYYKPERASSPLLLQAIQSPRIFMYLLRHGATLDVKEAVESLLKDNTSERLDVLKQIHTDLISKVNARRIKKEQKKLHKLDVECDKKLDDAGLFKAVKGKNKYLSPDELIPIAKRYEQSDELVQLLYELCLSAPSTQEENTLESLSRVMTGLLVKHTPQNLVAVLTELCPFLLPTQKLVCLYLVKEMIQNDSFYACYRNEHFCNEVLPVFLREANAEAVAGLPALFQEMIKLQCKINHPLVRATAQVETIISLCDGTQQEETMTDPVGLANELRSITSQFMRTLQVSELANKAWEDKHNKDKLSPTIIRQFEHFNKTSHYFVSKILHQAPENRMAYIELCVRTINELITTDPVDFHSAMALSSALENIALNRFMKVFMLSHNKATKMWAQAQQTLSNRSNYAVMRDMITNSKLAFPWQGLFTKDLMSAGELRTLKSKAVVEGKIFSDIIKLQNKAKTYPSTSLTSRLGYLLNKQTELTDEVLDKIVMRVDPTHIRLDTLMTVPQLIELVKVYCELKQPIKANYVDGGGKKEGIPAIKAILDWVKEKNIQDTALLKSLFDEMAKLPDARFCVEIYSKHMFNPSPEIAAVESASKIQRRP